MSDSVADLISPDVLDDFDRLRGDCGTIPLPELSIIELRGDDRKGWLQGQATNDLKQLDNGASSAFCLCSPTGQILAVCDIWGLKDRFLLTCHASCAPAFRKRVEQMVILEDVEARDITQEVHLLSVQGPNATRALGDHLSLPTLDAGLTTFQDQEVVCLRSNRTGLGGWDLLFPSSPSSSLGCEFAPISASAFDIARLEAGVPLAGQDFEGKTLPPELGPAFEARHVSYNKGCYTGQEVLMRIHSRGHTNKTWVGLRSESPLARGNLVSHGRRAESGIVTSACYSPDFGFIAGAMLRNEAAQDRETVHVATSDGVVESEVCSMPFLRFG